MAEQTTTSTARIHFFKRPAPNGMKMRDLVVKSSIIADQSAADAARTLGFRLDRVSECYAAAPDHEMHKARFILYSQHSYGK